jgi:hypothetical protein
MARTIQEWAESGVGSEVRAVYMAGPGRRSNEDDPDADKRSGGDQGGRSDEEQEERKRGRSDDDDGMEPDMGGGARE